MDENTPVLEISEDATRESLIAISYTAPENDPGANHSKEKVIKENELKAKDADTYRSELISISYQSPDPNALPVRPDEDIA